MTTPHLYPSPPRLLIGAAVLVWGALTGHSLIGLAAALLIEARHWVDWRWHFGEKGYSRAWVLSLFALTGTVGFHSLNAIGPASFLAFLEWLPLIFLPLILAQQYGEEDTVPTTVFSFIARKRQQRDRKLGKVVIDSRIQLGYPYFALAILSAGYPADGPLEKSRFLSMLLILMMISLYFVHRREQRRLLPWIVLVVLVSSLTTLSSRGIERLYEWAKASTRMGRDASDPREEQNTRIGKLGQLKLDRRIHWRLTTPADTQPPYHLMALSYNFYRQGKWRAIDSEFSEYERSYQDLLTLAGEENDGKFAFRTEDFAPNSPDELNSQPLVLRGAVDTNRKALPAPSGLRLISEAQEIDAVEINSLGSLLVINASSVIDIQLANDGLASLREPDPIQGVRNDALVGTGPTELSLPDDFIEADVLTQIVEQLELDQLTDFEKVAALKEYFHDNFKYSTYLTISDEQPLVEFLQTNKTGHCEYFGTATTLLLRAAGVPARYVVGYAVREQSQNANEYVMRGTHAHAWCRAYLGGHQEIVEEEREVLRNGRTTTVTLQRVAWTGGEWVDVDLTPPDWLAADSPIPSFREKVSDSLQRMREDFQIWRSSESNRGWVNLVLALVALAVLLFVAWRLSGSRIRKGKENAQQQKRPESIGTSLSTALPLLEKNWGERPQGQVLGQWLHEKLIESDTLTAYSESNYHRLVMLHESQRFGEHSFNPADEQEFSSLVELLLKTCSQSTVV